MGGVYLNSQLRHSQRGLPEHERYSYNSVVSGVNGVQTVLHDLFQTVFNADPSVRMVDVNYPYVLATSNVCARTWTQGVKTWHGATSVIDELAKIHAAVSLKSGAISHIDLRTAFGANPLALLQLYRYYGYPHAKRWWPGEYG